MGGSGRGVGCEWEGVGGELDVSGREWEGSLGVSGSGRGVY